MCLSTHRLPWRNDKYAQTFYFANYMFLLPLPLLFVLALLSLEILASIRVTARA